MGHYSVIQLFSNFHFKVTKTFVEDWKDYKKNNNSHCIVKVERLSLYNKYTLTKKYMERVVFNPAQREVLDVMSCMQTDEDLQALKAVLVQFLNDRLQRELDRLWDNGTIDETKMNEWRNTHYRTPYRQ